MTSADRQDPAHATPSRGRDAPRPSHIPLRGWWDIGWRILRDFNNDNLAMVARSIAFSGVMALFPGLAAFVALYGLFADASTARNHLALLSGIVPADALLLIGDEMVRIASQTPASLSLTFGLSLLTAVWAANTGVKSLIRGLNIAYAEGEKRSLLALNLMTLAWTVGGFVFLLLTAGALVLAPLVISLFPAFFGLTSWSWTRWPAFLLLTLVALALLYRHGPSRRPARWRWLTWGGLIAAALWLAGSQAFSWYVEEFAGFSATYGSLGAIFGFLAWSWLSAVAILLGAKVNAEIEHQTGVDSTVGPDRPRGSRGAVMADTLGTPLDTTRWVRMLRNLNGLLKAAGRRLASAALGVRQGVPDHDPQRDGDRQG